MSERYSTYDRMTADPRHPRYYHQDTLGAVMIDALDAAGMAPAWVDMSCLVHPMVDTPTEAPSSSPTTAATATTSP